MKTLNFEKYQQYKDIRVDRQVRINEERCRKIMNFPDYMISESGRIYRITPFNNREKCLMQDLTNLYIKELNYKGKTIKKGKHCRVKLRDSSGNYKYRLPVLLLSIAFGLIPRNYKSWEYNITYKDGNAKNVTVNNVEFIKIKRLNSKLDAKKVVQIKRLIKLNQPLSHIAKVYNISDTMVRKIKKGESWQ